jgi:hypothetical protein
MVHLLKRPLFFSLPHHDPQILCTSLDILLLVAPPDISCPNPPDHNINILLRQFWTAKDLLLIAPPRQKSSCASPASPLPCPRSTCTCIRIRVCIHPQDWGICLSLRERISAPPLVLFSLITLPSLARASPAGFTTTLDRLRAFRRRQESPSVSPGLAVQEEKTARAKSPGWRAKMDRLRTSTKRAHSPATPPPENASNLPQTDGACFGKPDQGADAAPAAKIAKADGPDAGAATEDGPLEMPAFLQLTDIGKWNIVPTYSPYSLVWPN